MDGARSAWQWPLGSPGGLAFEQPGQTVELRAVAHAPAPGCDAAAPQQAAVRIVEDHLARGLGAGNAAPRARLCRPPRARRPGTRRHPGVVARQVRAPGRLLEDHVGRHPPGEARTPASAAAHARAPDTQQRVSEQTRAAAPGRAPAGSRPPCGTTSSRPARAWEPRAGSPPNTADHPHRDQSDGPASPCRAPLSSSACNARHRGTRPTFADLEQPRRSVPALSTLSRTAAPKVSGLPHAHLARHPARSMHATGDATARVAPPDERGPSSSADGAG